MSSDVQMCMDMYGTPNVIFYSDMSLTPAEEKALEEYEKKSMCPLFQSYYYDTLHTGENTSWNDPSVLEEELFF